MSRLEDLGIELGGYFLLSKSKLKRMSHIIEGMVLSGTVSLPDVVNSFEEGNTRTNYKKVQDFFRDNDLHDDDYISFIVDTLFKDTEALTLAIDRTEWSYGKTWHNLLIVSVLYEGSAVPLAILPLERKGNSSSQQRIDLIEKILRVIPSYRIEMIIGDREFIGDKWFTGLCDRVIPFVMRIRDNITVHAQDKLQTIAQLPDNFEGEVHIGSQLLTLKKKKIKKGILCIISSLTRKPIEAYKLRWKIETGFKCLKSNGFNLEKTHLREGRRLKTLTQLASIATMLALKTAQIIQPKEANTKKNMDFLQSQNSKPVIAF